MITASGIGSGLDVNTLVGKLISAERDPVTARLNRQEGTLQAKISAYGSLQGAMSSLQTSLAGLQDGSSFNGRSVSVGDTTKYTASVTADAVVGSHSINVSALAQAHGLSMASSLANLTDTVGTGTLTFNFGTTVYDPVGDIYTSFTANTGKSQQQVTITDGSLQGIRDAINTAAIGVSASTIYDGSGYRLVLKGETGAVNSMQISVAESGATPTNTDSTGLSQLAFNATATQLNQTQAAQDAALTIDGLAVSATSNTVDKALQGVSLNLLVTTTTAVDFTVSQDSGSISGAVSGFVTAYNGLISSMDQLSGYDSTTKKAGILLGDSAVRQVGNEMRRLLSDAGRGLSGKYNSLAAIGITTQASKSTDASGKVIPAGSLQFDSSKLSAALASDPQAVSLLFSSFGTTTDSGISFNSATTSTKTGTYGIDVTTLATSGNYTGTAGITNITLSSANNNFALNVDGVATGTVSLTAGTYNTPTLLAQLATEMQANINADSNMLAANLGVKVAYDSTAGKFTITSNSYGTVSSITTAASNATLGLLNGTATTGVDVVGTIGGGSATGSGQVLTGTGDAAGLAVNVTGTALNSRGTITYNRGYAFLADQSLTVLLDSKTGAVSASIDGTQAGVTRITEQRAELDKRITSLEARYRKQFSALDALVSKLQSTGSFLTSALSTFSGRNG